MKSFVTTENLPQGVLCRVSTRGNGYLNMKTQNPRPKRIGKHTAHLVDRYRLRGSESTHIVAPCKRGGEFMKHRDFDQVESVHFADFGWYEPSDEGFYRMEPQP